MQHFPVFVAEKTSVFDQQCICRDVFPQLLDELLFRVLPTTKNECQFDMSSQFNQADLADLRECSLTTTS